MVEIDSALQRSFVDTALLGVPCTLGGQKSIRAFI